MRNLLIVALLHQNSDEYFVIVRPPSFRRTTSRSRRRPELPVLTNTSLMLLRLCGKYTHLMKDLKPIASDVFRAMTQLLDFYVIAVYAFFTKDLVRSQVASSRDSQ